MRIGYHLFEKIDKKNLEKEAYQCVHCGILYIVYSEEPTELYFTEVGMPCDSMTCEEYKFFKTEQMIKDIIE